jgi:hypothetical protein
LRSPGVEQRHRERRAERPEPGRRAQPLRSAARAEAERAGERQRREERRGGDADLGVRRGDAPLGRRDVGPALEQRRRQPGRDHGELCHVARLRSNREVGRGDADQQRDRMLELRALHADVDRLRQRALQLRVGLDHVGARADPGAVAVLGQRQRFLERLRRVLEQLALRIEHAQLEIVRRQLRLQREPRRGEIACARLHRGLVRLERPAQASPQIDVPARVDADRAVRLRACRPASGRA